ncbi:hypothetical protein HAX54_041721, partial [Datura stramonium]|nr:hypothetical protein [Datura stramonium]
WIYSDRNDIGWSRDEAYIDKSESEPLEVRKCGVYVAAYAEYLNNRVDIHVVEFEANLH